MSNDRQQLIVYCVVSQYNANKPKNPKIKSLTFANNTASIEVQTELNTFQTNDAADTAADDDDDADGKIKIGKF